MPAPPPQPLGMAGRAFFGSLCAGTFGLGVWQTQRYFESTTNAAERERQLALPPRSIRQEATASSPWQRLQVQGQFQHDKELYVGPRGAPVAVSPGGMSPQGYYVWTPLQLAKKGKHDTDDVVVLINRGWVPRQMVETKTRSGQQQQQTPWSCPTGPVSLTVVPSKTETPRFLVPEHSHLQQRTLVWMDRPAMMALGGVAYRDDDDTLPLLLTQVAAEDASKDDCPMQPTMDHMGRPKISPAMHVGYAVTWYGLAAAGIYMTRKLIRKGA